MIIVVEGPSVTGKTTWVAAHCEPAMVIGETPAEPTPDRATAPDAAAAHWAAITAGRWHATRLTEQRTSTAVCDTDRSSSTTSGHCGRPVSLAAAGGRPG
jgi:hypothetical protein